MLKWTGLNQGSVHNYWTERRSTAVHLGKQTEHILFIFQSFFFSFSLCLFLFLHAYWLTVSFFCCSLNLFSPSCLWIAWGEKRVCVSIRVCTWVCVQIYIFYEQMYVFFTSSLVCGCEGWILCHESIGNLAAVVSMPHMDDRNPPLKLLPFSQASKATLKQAGQQTPKGF